MIVTILDVTAHQHTDVVDITYLTSTDCDVITATDIGGRFVLQASSLPEELEYQIAKLAEEFVAHLECSEEFSIESIGDDYNTRYLIG